MFIVVGFTVWGKGDTEEAAFAAAKKVAGVKLLKRRIVYTTDDPDAYVDEAGGIVTHKGTTLTEVKRVIETKGGGKVISGGR